MRTQTMVQLTESLVARLDARATAEGVSRSHLIRQAVEAFLAADRHADAVQQFHHAYATNPETVDELAVAEATARAMVADEPW